MEHSWLAKLLDPTLIKPDERSDIIKVLYRWSIYGLMPSLIVTWFLPKIGIVLLQLYSVVALTLTLGGWLQATDVRQKQEEDADASP